MQRREDQLEMALDLFKAGVDQDTHMLLATANNMLSLGYMKMVDITIPLSELNSEREEELRDSGVTGLSENNSSESPHHSAGQKMRPFTSSRPLSESGVQWGTDWVDPNNTTPPKPGMQRKWSGWQGMNKNQLWVLNTLTGEKGRYTIGIQSVRNYITKHGDSKGRTDRKHIKPHYLMNSLSRRGLITEIDKDVWILTPRGQMYVREFLGLEPTPKHDAVSSVA